MQEHMENDRIRPAAFSAALVAELARTSNDTIKLVPEDLDCASLPFDYVNRSAGIGCNVSVYDDGLFCQVYGYKTEADWSARRRNGVELAMLETEFDLPQEVTPALVEALTALLGQADYLGHEQGYCDLSANCAWCETHQRGNCDGPEHCKNCADDRADHQADRQGYHYNLIGRAYVPTDGPMPEGCGYCAADEKERAPMQRDELVNRVLAVRRILLAAGTELSTLRNAADTAGLLSIEEVEALDDAVAGVENANAEDLGDLFPFVEPAEGACQHVEVDVMSQSTSGATIDLYVTCRDCGQNGVRLIDLSNAEQVEWDEVDAEV